MDIKPPGRWTLYLSKKHVLSARYLPSQVLREARSGFSAWTKPLDFLRERCGAGCSDNFTYQYRIIGFETFTYLLVQLAISSLPPRGAALRLVVW
jgi:hypothetical protein